MIDGITKEQALEFYRKLKLIRRFEETVIELVNKNEIYGTTHESIGQEAVAVGICSAMRGDDYITSTHRGHGHAIAKGGDIKYMFCELMGRANGYNGGKGGSMHIADPDLGILGANGIVGAGVPIACGAALAIKLRKGKQVVGAFYGDGASNQGVVHEAMNMAAIWSLPVVFVCENNRYAVSTSIEYSTRIKNLSERAAAYGFQGRAVDGMDVAKVYAAAKKVFEATRSGQGPFLLECKTYRFEGHFTAEPILGLHYRTDGEIKHYMERCPVKNWKRKILEEGVCSSADIEKIDTEIENMISEAVDFARKSKLPDEKSAFEDMYSTVYNGIPQKGYFPG